MGRGPWRRLPYVGRADVAADVRDEIESHLAMQAADLEKQDLSPEAARAEAVRMFGRRVDIEREMRAISGDKERSMRRARWLDELRQDLAYSLRLLLRAPGFSAVVILTLAVGVGANTAVFSAVDAALLSPLPYEQADRLVSVWSRYAPESGHDFEWMSLSAPELRDYATATQAMAGVAPYNTGQSNIVVGTASADRASVGYVAADMFDLLGIAPALGRTFTAAEGAAGAACTVVLSSGLWLEQFGGSPSAIGERIRLDGEPCEVVGVMPRGFFFPNEEVRVWRAFNTSADPRLAEDRQSHWLAAVARLKRGVSLEQAHSELEPLMSAWRTAHDHHTGHTIVLRPFRDEIVAGQGTALVLLLGAVGLVLVIICANLANLLLTRAEGRRREVAVRAALGAGQWRLTRQLLAESAFLTLLGGAGAVLLSGLFVRAIRILGAATLPLAQTARLNVRVLAFTIGVTILSGVLLAILPVLSARALRLQEVLRAGGRNATGHVGSTRVRRGLVIGEIAVSVAVVSAAAVLVRSYDQLRRVDVGVAEANAALMDVTLSASDYGEQSRIAQFFAELRTTVAAQPGVRAAGFVSEFPLRAAPGMDSFRIEGRPDPQPGEPSFNGGYLMATPGYFEAAGIPLLRGRLIEERDVRGAPLVAVIDERAARAYFPDADPLGQRIRYYGADSAWITIVGVVGSVRYGSPRQDPTPAVYTAHAQAPRSGFYTGRAMTLVLRSTGRLAPESAVRAIVQRLDPQVPVTNVSTVERVISAATGRPRFTTTLMSFFALVSLFVGALGVYGVLSYHVRSQTHEIGIRMALGAGADTVRRMILRQGLLLAAAGVAAGAVLSLLSAHLLTSVVYGVRAADPLILAGVGLVLFLTSLLASYLPARRATRIDPSTAFRV